MGRIINAKASADRILRDVTVTLAVAEATGPEMFADAEEYLADVMVRAAEVDAQYEEHEELLLRYRAQLKAGNERCNDLIQQIRDEYFNLIGRASRDPIFKRVFPGGGSRFTGFRPKEKGMGMELLASALKAHRHRRVGDAEVERMAGALRAEAAKMADLVALLSPAVVQARVFVWQRTATAQMAHQRLTALKRFWLGEGLSEAEIHEVIPSHARKRPAAGGAGDDGEGGLEEEEDLAEEVEDEWIEEAVAK